MNDYLLRGLPIGLMVILLIRIVVTKLQIDVYLFTYTKDSPPTYVSVAILSLVCAVVFAVLGFCNFVELPDPPVFFFVSAILFFYSLFNFILHRREVRKDFYIEE